MQVQPVGIDVFVSYARADAAHACRLADALRLAGLQVWIDDAAIDDFTGITDAIREGIQRSTVLLAWYSSAFSRSTACQWEITAAYLDAQRAGIDPRERVLVVNPEAGNRHIHQGLLRDARFVAVSGQASDGELDAVAGAVRSHLHKRKTTDRFPKAPAAPRWYPEVRPGSARFVGRLRAMWEIHSHLWAEEHAVTAPRTGASMVMVTGLGGLGKSLLAEEYARRFGTVYAGGVFWLEALGHDEMERSVTSAERLARLDSQMRAIAIAMRLPAAALSSDEVTAAVKSRLENEGLPFLWIVDDLPPDLQYREFVRWLAPGRLGRTLITTRSRGYDAQRLDLDPLAPDEALQLLTHQTPPDGESEQQAAARVAKVLGFHPLALDVARAAIRHSSYGLFESALAQPSDDALEMAAELTGLLPNGHEASIAVMLIGSIDRLQAEGTELLLVATALATAPIALDFAAAILAAGSDDEGREGLRRAQSAFHQLSMFSLGDISGSPAHCTVHSLVSRVMVRRLSSVARLQRQRLQSVASDVLFTRLKDAVRDGRNRKAIELDVTHARTLASDAGNSFARQLLVCLRNHDLEQGRSQLAYEEARRAWRVERRRLGAEHALTMTLLDAVGVALLDRGSRARARTLHTGLLALRSRVLGSEHVDTLRSMHNLAGALASLGNHLGARALQEQALSLMGQVLGPDHAETLRTMHNLAATLTNLGELDQANVLMDRVVAFRTRTLGPDHPDTLLSMNDLAQVHKRRRFWSDALKLAEEVLATQTRLLGREHPSTIMSINNVSQMLVSHGDLERAHAMALEAFTLQTRLRGVDHPLTIAAMNNLASVLTHRDDLSGGRRLYEQALALHTQVAGREHPDTLVMMNNVAHTALKVNDLNCARSTFAELVELRTRLNGPSHPDTLAAMAQLGFTMLSQNELLEARPLFEAVLAARRGLFPLEHSDRSAAAFNLYWTLALLGAGQEAHKLVETELTWLLDHGPESLTEVQRTIRAHLEKMEHRR